MRGAMWAGTVAAALLSACSSSLITPQTSANSSGSARVTFVVVVPGARLGAFESREQRPHFISASTQSITVTLGGQTILTKDVSASSTACRSGARGSRTCTAQTTVPSGAQIFFVTAFDETNGSGNKLASGNVPAMLFPGSTQRVRVSLSGTPASISLYVRSPYPPAGTAATSSVIIAAFDADGNTIVGDYGKSVAIADSDKSGATTLSTTSVSNSSTGVTLAYDGAPLSQAMLSTRANGLARANATFAPSPTTVAQYVAPPVQAHGAPLPVGLWDVCIGPDGNIWGTANTAGGVEKISRDGTFTAYPVLHSETTGISVGSDNNLWFAEEALGKIGKITLGGKITSYSIPVPPGATSSPYWTTLGPDGRTWFVDQGRGAVSAGSITSAGKIATYRLPLNSAPVEIVSGPDGNLWITDSGLNAILVLSASGKVVAVHRLPTPGAQPYGIAVGPDKNVWFAELTANRIGRMTIHGSLKEFAVPTAFADPINVTAGPDGNIWFVESGGGFWDSAGKIGYVTTDGSVIRDFPTAGVLAHVHDLVFDSHGILWYTKNEFTYSALGKLVY